MAELIVNTGALLQNYRRYADAGQVIPVLKGNGYGLGAQPLRDLLARQGVTLFACATPEEALALAQPETDLLLLCCVHELPLLRALLQRRVILSVESLAQAQAIDALHMDARVHLAVDSGFGRFGFLPEQTEEMKRVFALDNLRVQGIFSHFRGAAAACMYAAFFLIFAAGTPRRNSLPGSAGCCWSWTAIPWGCGTSPPPARRTYPNTGWMRCASALA